MTYYGCNIAELDSRALKAIVYPLCYRYRTPAEDALYQAIRAELDSRTGRDTK